MNNKELYQKTFSRLHASEDLELEDIIMKKKKFRLSKMVACFIAALVLTSVLGVGAYAAVSGDFLGTVKVFFTGDAGDVNMVMDLYQQDVSTFILTDPDNPSYARMVDICRYYDFKNPPVVTEEEGRILISYQDQVINITEEMEKNGQYEYVYEDDGEKIMMVSFTEEGDINTAFCDVEEGNEIEK